MSKFQELLKTTREVSEGRGGKYGGESGIIVKEYGLPEDLPPEVAEKWKKFMTSYLHLSPEDAVDYFEDFESWNMEDLLYSMSTYIYDTGKEYSKKIKKEFPEYYPAAVDFFMSGLHDT